MNNELNERIIELENRLKKIEKVEERRRNVKIAKIAIRVIILLIVIYAGYRCYVYVNDTFIKPYKETVDELVTGYNKIKNSPVFSKLIG